MNPVKWILRCLRRIMIMSDALKGLDQLEPEKILDEELKPVPEVKPEESTESENTKEEKLDSRIDPILRPKNWKTTSILTKGEVKMVMALIAFCKTSPLETVCVLEFCEDFCYLKLSESGFAIEKAIDLGKALAEKQITGIYKTELCEYYYSKYKEECRYRSSHNVFCIKEVIKNGL
jgi:hypothetical protein